MNPADDAAWTSLQELQTLACWAEGRARAVEVGTWKGRSAEAIAFGQGDEGRLWCVDDWSGDPDERTRRLYFPQSLTPGGVTEVREAWRERMKDYLHRVTLVERTSEVACCSFADGSLDMVFLDGCHIFEVMLCGLAAWQPKVKPGGLLCGHDADQSGVVRALLERFPGMIEYGPGKLWRTRQ